MLVEIFENKLIPQAVLGSFKDVIGTWDAIELIANRVTAGEQVEAALTNELGPYGFSIRNLELTNISYEGEFEHAVEAKVKAVQLAEEAKNNTIRIEEEAKQTIIAANAEAESMAIKTKALEQSPSLIYFEAVQKWDGVMPKLITGAGGNLLNIPADVLN